MECKKGLSGFHLFRWNLNTLPETNSEFAPERRAINCIQPLIFSRVYVGDEEQSMGFVRSLTNQGFMRSHHLGSVVNGVYNNEP